MSSITQEISLYADSLKILENIESQLTPSQVLSVLRARDRIRLHLLDEKPDAFDNLILLIELDERLNRQAERIIKVAKLVDWRTSFQPATDAWWWHFAEKPTWWERTEWFWSFLTILLITICLGLVADISNRFLSDGPDTWAIMTVVGQSVLALLVAGGALTQTGQEAVKYFFLRFKIPTGVWPVAKFILNACVLGCLIILRLSLPQISTQYNNLGLQNYYAGA